MPLAPRDGRMVAVRPSPPRNRPGDAMNRRILSRLLLAGVIACAAFAASAQTPATSVATDASAQAQLAGDTDVDGNFDSKATPQIDRNCLRQTGSRIVATRNASRNSAARDRDTKSGHRCVAANGRVYSREDLDRTGETDIADALRKLDPSIY